MLQERAAADHTTPEQGRKFFFIAFIYKTTQPTGCCAVPFLANGNRAPAEVQQYGEPDALAATSQKKELLLANDEYVGKACGKGVVDSILDVPNVEGPMVTLTVADLPNTSQDTTTNDHDQMTVIELDDVLDLSVIDLKLDHIVNLDGSVRVTPNGSLGHRVSRDTGHPRGLSAHDGNGARTVEETEKKNIVINS